MAMKCTNPDHQTNMQTQGSLSYLFILQFCFFWESGGLLSSAQQHMTVLKATGNVNQLFQAPSRPAEVGAPARRVGGMEPEPCSPLSFPCFAVETYALSMEFLSVILHHRDKDRCSTHSFNKYLLSKDPAPGTVPSALGTVVRKMGKACPGVYILT